MVPGHRCKRGSSPATTGGKTYMCSENTVKGQQDTEAAKHLVGRGGDMKRDGAGMSNLSRTSIEARVGSCFSPRWFESGGLKPLQRYELQRFGL